MASPSSSQTIPTLNPEAPGSVAPTHNGATEEEMEEDLDEWQVEDKWTPIHVAAQDLNIPKLKSLLASSRFPINATTRESNHTALHTAVLAWYNEDDPSTQVEVVKLLAAHGADLNPHDCVGATPLHEAASGNYVEVARALLALGADVNADNREPERAPSAHPGGCGCGNAHGIGGLLAALTGGSFRRSEYRKDSTPLHVAAQKGSPEMVRLLLDHGAKVDAFDLDDGTPLTCGVLGGNLEVCKILLEREGGVACLGVKQKQGNLPIHYAGTAANPEILRLLIEKGADVDVAVDQPDSWAHGRTALSAACREGKGMEENVRILLAAGADPNRELRNKATPFLLALVSGNVKVAQLLLDHGANLSSIELPPLLAAATKGHADICKLLIGAGCPVNIKTTDGDEYTPLHNAAGYGGNKETIAILASAGADLEARNYDGRRPLHMAAFKGQVECVRELLKRGADIESEDDNSWTPLHFASRYGHKDVVELLLNPGEGRLSAQVGKRTTGGPGDGELDDCTAADLARSNGHEDIVCLLVAAGDTLSPKEDADGESE